MPDLTARTSWRRPWTWAIVPALGLFSAHSTTRWWWSALLSRRFGQVPDTVTEIPPLMGVLLVVWGLVSALGGTVIGVLINEGSRVRHRRRWQREETLRRQLWDMERQIREEGMSEEERQWHQQYRQRQAEIKAEARRRLGLPEETDENGIL